MSQQQMCATCIVVDLGDCSIDIPVEIEDGLPVARPDAETYQLLQDRGMTDSEIDDLLWQCEHAN